MSYINRNYRTNLAMKGLVFLDKKEHKCTIKNLSTNGIKMEIIPGQYFNNIPLFSKAIIISDIVNFSIPEMHLDGEAKIIRQDIIDNKIYLSLSFANVFFGLDHVPYRRQYYRTLRRTTGQISFGEQNYDVICNNVSLSGMLIASTNQLNINSGGLLKVDFEKLNIHGQAQLIWSKKIQKQYLIGIKYSQLQEPVKGIASFKT